MDAAKLRRIAYRLVRARGIPASVDVQDLVQAAWVRLLRLAPREWVSEEHRENYATVAARGAMADELRAQYAPPYQDGEVLESLPASPAESPHETVEQAQSLRVLRTAVAGLRLRLREVVNDHLAGVAVSETAGRLGVSSSRVAQLHREALDLLRIRLAVPFSLDRSEIARYRNLDANQTESEK